MNTTWPTTYNLLCDRKPELADYITAMHYKSLPLLGTAGKEKYRTEIILDLAYLAESVKWEAPLLFIDYLRWVQEMRLSHYGDNGNLIKKLGYIDIACKQRLPAQNYHALSVVLNEGTESLQSPAPLPETRLTKDNPMMLSARQYLAYLLAADKTKARDLIFKLLEQGRSVADIYQYIFEATQYEVGLLWQNNKISVGQEHYCTAVTQFIISAVYQHIFNKGNKRGKLIACTIAGDLHEMGVRMLADLFEIGGWDTYYMGANMPDEGIISVIKQQQADILAISVSMPLYLTSAETLITKIRSDERLKDVKIIIGGHPFNRVPQLWKRIGADGYAVNAREALELANQFITTEKILR